MPDKRTCAVKEPATHMDACACKVTELYKCNLPDSTCRQRAVVANAGAGTVDRAHAYDRRLAAEADMNKNKLLANCHENRRTCPHKAAPAPGAPVDGDMDSNGQPTGDGQRGDCEIAQKRFGYNILLQPISDEPWRPSPDYQGPPDNNDRNYNVIGQRVLRGPAPAKALPLSQLGADSKLNRGKSRYNVIGQRLLDPRHVCVRQQYVDMRPTNVIGQPVFPPIPPPPPKQKPPDPMCLCTPMAF